EQDPHDGPFLMVDVGGGSTEFVLGTWDGRHPDIHRCPSVDIGCVRITERALTSDPPTRAEIAAAESLSVETVSVALDTLEVSKARTWIGVAGTMTTLSAIVHGLDEYDSERIH